LSKFRDAKGPEIPPAAHQTRQGEYSFILKGAYRRKFGDQLLMQPLECDGVFARKERSHGIGESEEPIVLMMVHEKHRPRLRRELAERRAKLLESPAPQPISLPGLQDMILESFAELGGEQYLKHLAYTHPAIHSGLLRKLLAQKQGKAENPNSLLEVTTEVWRGILEARAKANECATRAAGSQPLEHEVSGERD
jgi:hypothetical protein